MEKTYLLNAIEALSNKNNSGLTPASVRTQAPIGKFNIGNIQPLYPFTKAVEYLLSDAAKAKKKFALRAGLTVLTGIPIAGDFIYMVKELGKDWRQFKKDKSSDSQKKMSSGAADYYDTISSLADKSPLILLIDDMHFSDAQSVELLSMFTESIEKIPLILVFTYKKTQIQRKGTPLLSYLNKFADGKSQNLTEMSLQQFNRMQLSNFCRFSLPNYKANEKFENWLYDRSYGVPGVLAEYMNYFQHNTPFTDDGNLKENFADSDFLPASVQSAFAKLLDKISEEERNTLAICSAEGRKFTAMIVSELLNTDVLTTIKKLRSLQTKTGVIKSVGAQMRYGVKTTVYEFTQAFYHSFFESSLEYEEHIALHGQIAALLKQKFEDADNDTVKQAIAPYLAAHSAESGDEETTKSMLLVAAKAAKESGSDEIVQDAYNNFKEIEERGYVRYEDNGDEPEDSPENVMFRSIIQESAPGEATEETVNENGVNENGSEVSHNGDDYLDFKSVRKALVRAYHDRKFTFTGEEAVSYLKNHEDELTKSESAQLMSIAIRAYTESGDMGLSESLCDEALELINNCDDELAKCFVRNSAALYYYVAGQEDRAGDLLVKLAKKSNILPPELKLLTLSNIAALSKDNPQIDTSRYFDAVRRLADHLNYKDFASDILI